MSPKRSSTLACAACLAMAACAAGAVQPARRAPEARDGARAVPGLPMTLIDASLNRRAAVVGSFRTAASGEIEFTAAVEGSPPVTMRLAGAGARGGAVAPDTLLALAPVSWSSGESSQNMPLVLPRRDVPQRQAAPPGRPVSGWLSTADGQRLQGSINPLAEGAEERLTWEHPGFGTLSIPLDDLSVLALGVGASAMDVLAGSTSASSDRLLLLNGDELSGFIASIGANVLLEPAPGPGGGRAIEMPLERVAEVRMSAAASSAAGPRLWLSNGSVVAVKAIRDSTRLPGRIVIEPTLSGTPSRSEATPEKAMPAGGEATIFVEDLLAITGDASGVVPFSSMVLAGATPVGERRRVEPPRLSAPGALGVADILLAGPMIAEWMLPEGASRVSGEVVLHPDAGVWGDCRVSIETVGAGASDPPVTLASARVNASTPRMEFNRPVEAIAGARLRVRVDPGEFGPVQDVVVLRNALIRVVK